MTVRSRCEVLSSRAAGAFQSVTLVAPEIAEPASITGFHQFVTTTALTEDYEVQDA